MAVLNTEILASGATALPSSTVSVDQGAVNTLILRSTDEDAGLEIEIQTSDGWVRFGSLSAKNPVEQVRGPGNYRLWRNAGNSAAADKAV